MPRAVQCRPARGWCRRHRRARRESGAFRAWLAFSGLFLVYTDIGLSFDRATGGDARVLAGLLLLWGVAATVGNLAAGRLTDRFGSHRIINTAIAVVAVDFALLPWTSASLATAVPALVVWGCAAGGCSCRSSTA
jgi:predicted MFS family arabinose efflux permease